MSRSVLYLFYLITLVSCSANPSEYVLFDFESPATLDELSWKCHTVFSLADAPVAHGSHSLRMELYPSDTPGFAHSVSKGDWTGFHFFCADIFNASDHGLKMGVRIDDKFECPDLKDCCIQYIPISPGWNTVKIPLGQLKTLRTQRVLDVSSIVRIFFFLVNPPEKTVVYLDYVRLI